MTAADWSASYSHAVAVAARGFALLINAWVDPVEFRLPAALRGAPLSVRVDTASGAVTGSLFPADQVTVAGRALMLLER